MLLRENWFRSQDTGFQYWFCTNQLHDVGNPLSAGGTLVSYSLPEMSAGETVVGNEFE